MLVDADAYKSYVLLCFLFELVILFTFVFLDNIKYASFHKHCQLVRIICKIKIQSAFVYRSGDKRIKDRIAQVARFLRLDGKSSELQSAFVLFLLFSPLLLSLFLSFVVLLASDVY